MIDDYQTENKMGTRPKLLKTLILIYALYLSLFLLSYIVSLYINNDFLLVKAPRNFEWIAGELVAILGTLWGILVVLFTMIKRAAGQMLAVLLLLLALSINILVGWINWKMGSFLGVPMAILLFLLPSLLLIGTRNALTTPGDSPSP